MMPSEHGEYYNIDTAGYYRKSKWKESEEVIADLSEPSQSDAVTDASKPQVPDKDGVGPINTEAQLPSSGSKDNTNSSNLQENAGISLDGEDNVSDSVGLNFGGGPDRGRVNLSDVKRYAQSVKVPERITSQAQAVSWAYQALGGIRGMLSSLYEDRGSKDFSMGLLSMDPTKGREMDIDKALYSRGRVRQYLDIVQPKLYEARDNSTSEETRKFFQDLIDDCNYARQWYDRAAES